ncbi:hypothetical protein [Sediminicoccus sp. KRV36]|uniref:hypothetical protein n=1 Tax=Sediminicoccus sp. KRV36 TaxID=3133721 RepID=UPI00200D38BA|nr:hypothetical protein [Sediminicoccus rosea]UPY37245.1 hypothetical protein LHU95_00715 [Sediminicoccus rosea]
MIAITSFIRLPFLNIAPAQLRPLALLSKTRANAKTQAWPGLADGIARFSGIVAGVKTSLSPHLLHKTGMA